MLAKFRLHYKVALNRSVFTGFRSDFKVYTYSTQLWHSCRQLTIMLTLHTLTVLPPKTLDIAIKNKELIWFTSEGEPNKQHFL